MNRLSPEEFDRVRSLYNVGSVMRTADAMALEAVYLCEITATPPHPEIHKTALGAEDTVEWKYFQHTLDAVKELRERGYEIWSVEQCEGSTKLQDLNTHPQSLPKGGQSDMLSTLHSNENPSLREGHRVGVSLREGHRVGVIFGNEVKGVHQEVIDMSDGCLEIPQFGTKHSMNVSVTAGIVIWEFARRFLLSAE